MSAYGDLECVYCSEIYHELDTHECETEGLIARNESLAAQLEAATAALEEIQLVSYQRYGGIVTVDIANAALKSIKAASGRGEG